MIQEDKWHHRHHHPFGRSGNRSHGHGRSAGGPTPGHPHDRDVDSEWGNALPGGHRGRARRGEARYILLDVLKDGPLHGYEIIRLLQERSAGAYVPSPGTVYPTLQHLEDMGLVTAIQEDSRKVYQLTDDGRQELTNHAAEIALFWSQFVRPHVSGACGTETTFLKHETQDLLRTLWFGVDLLTANDDATGLKALRQVIEQCKANVRTVITQVQGPPVANSDTDKE